jgi:hypothetical protein
MDGALLKRFWASRRSRTELRMHLPDEVGLI